MTVKIKEGTWADAAGNLGVGSTQVFGVYSNAESFELKISGSMELFLAVDSLRLASVSGWAKLSVDKLCRHPPTSRWTCKASST